MTEKETTTISEAPLSQMTPVSEPVSDVGELSQWQLIVLRFRKNKLAMGGVVLLVIKRFPKRATRLQVRRTKNRIRQTPVR